jgi:hypothetical protein
MHSDKSAIFPPTLFGNMLGKGALQGVAHFTSAHAESLRHNFDLDTPKVTVC